MCPVMHYTPIIKNVLSTFITHYVKSSNGIVNDLIGVMLDFRVLIVFYWHLNTLKLTIKS